MTGLSLSAGRVMLTRRDGRLGVIVRKTLLSIKSYFLLWTVHEGCVFVKALKRFSVEHY